MNTRTYQEYIKILEEELVPAMGCTEPISIAYCASLARKTLGEEPDKVRVIASANIIKNVKSVVVPNTGGLHGIAAAASAGITLGNSNKELQVLAAVKENDIHLIQEFMDSHEITIEQSKKPYVFDIQIELIKGEHSSFCEIAGSHTNVISLKKDGECIRDQFYQEKENSFTTDRSLLNIKDIVTFADEVKISDVEAIIQRQIDYNFAIAEEGLKGNWGCSVGKILLEAYGNGVYNRAKAYAAAGSDARMSGCELPVIINSGSGNQGMTASLPVIIYAQELNVSHEQLIRALVVSNLVTLHLKDGIGRLSAYCGATSAGVGSGAGITYLYGGKANEISQTISNAVNIDSGMICDGAKSSCAAKIASAVEAGLLGFQMQRHNQEFHTGEGLVSTDVENTINNIGRLAHDGMKETDKTIIDMMIHDNNCD